MEEEKSLFSEVLGITERNVILDIFDKLMDSEREWFTSRELCNTLNLSRDALRDIYPILQELEILKVENIYYSLNKKSPFVNKLIELDAMLCEICK